MSSSKEGFGEILLFGVTNVKMISSNSLGKSKS